MKLLIKNGRLIDPASNSDIKADLLIEGGKICAIADNISACTKEIIDARNKIIFPGLIDMHVHMREPGREDKETINTATGAALKGGVTSCLAMPNTYPDIDCVKNVLLLKEIIKKTAQNNVFISAAITLGRRGEKLVDLSALAKEKIAAITDDGDSVDDVNLMTRALRQAKKYNLLLICHCEDKNMSACGSVNLGITSTRLGLRGISRESEYKRIERDIALAAKEKSRIHIAHVSCQESVEIIARAKKKGIQVTCETAPHYFALSEEAAWKFDTNMKMNPPLRRKQDAESIKQGLRDSTIDVIASDHAPHTENEKDIEFERAEFGVIGLETELSVSISELVSKGEMDWLGLARKTSLNPARILGIDKGNLAVGKDADIVIIDPDKEWIVEKKNFISKSKNSAFLGWKLKGQVEYTILQGKIAYRAGADLARPEVFKK